MKRSSTIDEMAESLASIPGHEQDRTNVYLLGETLKDADNVLGLLARAIPAQTVAFHGSGKLRLINGVRVTTLSLRSIDGVRGTTIHLMLLTPGVWVPDNLARIAAPGLTRTNGTWHRLTN